MTHYETPREELRREAEHRERQNNIKEQIQDMSLAEFTPRDLGSILRVMRNFEEGGVYRYMAPTEDLEYMEARLRSIKGDVASPNTEISPEG